MYKGKYQISVSYYIPVIYLTKALCTADLKFLDTGIL